MRSIPRASISPERKTRFARFRRVLGYAEQVLESAHQWLREEGARELPGGAPNDAGVRGVDVLNDSHCQTVASPLFLVRVGEADLLVEDLLRVGLEREKSGDHRVAVTHEESSYRGCALVLPVLPGETRAQQDRRTSECASREHEEGRLEGHRLAGFLIHAVGAGHPVSANLEGSHRDPRADRQPLPFGAAQEAGGVVLGFDGAWEAVAGVATHAARSLVAREVEGERDRNGRKPRASPAFRMRSAGAEYGIGGKG